MVLTSPSRSQTFLPPSQSYRLATGQEPTFSWVEDSAMELRVIAWKNLQWKDRKEELSLPSRERHWGTLLGQTMERSVFTLAIQDTE